MMHFGFIAFRRSRKGDATKERAALAGTAREAASTFDHEFFWGQVMRSRFPSIAALLCIVVTSVAPAKAATYDISASWTFDSALPSSITGSFTIDPSVGYASISNVEIQATLPLATGPFSFTFDQATWIEGGRAGTPGYIDFTNHSYGAGSTYFFMFLTFATQNPTFANLSSTIGTGFNNHQSQISVLGVGDWQGITGQMTLEPVAVIPEPPTWTMMLIGLAGFGFVAYRRNSKPAFMAA
jgi:hypothetical protein